MNKTEKLALVNKAKMKIYEATSLIEGAYGYNSSVELWITDPLKEIANEKINEYIDELEDDY